MKPMNIVGKIKKENNKVFLVTTVKRYEVELFTGKLDTFSIRDDEDAVAVWCEEVQKYILVAVDVT